MQILCLGSISRRWRLDGSSQTADCRGGDGLRPSYYSILLASATVCGLPSAVLPRRLQNRQAFTLLEMVTVLAIVAIAASLVVVNYREPVNNARLEHAFETIGRLDQRVRHWCKTNNTPARIRVDLDRGVFVAENGIGSPLAIPEAAIPNGMKLKELRIMGRNRFGRDTVIQYTSHGTTRCWAFSVAYSGNRERYQFIIGATGQAVPFDDADSLLRFERMYERE